LRQNEKALAGAEREQRKAQVAMGGSLENVNIIRPVWEKAGESNQLGDTRHLHNEEDADGDIN
jgi:hypothetical protein